MATVSVVASWFVLGVLIAAGGLTLSRYTTLRADLLVLGGAGGVAVVCLPVFWISFLDPRAGQAAGIVVTIAAIGAVWRWRLLLCRRAIAVPLCLMAGIALVYVAALLLWGTGPDPSTTAASRFLSLPPDNVIPTLFADRLDAGSSPKQLLGDWLSSDRPPLQTAVILVVRAPLRVLGLDPDDAAFGVAVGLQMLWVPALWGLLRRLGATSRVSTGTIVATACSGVILLHSVYTWPKFFAAAFVIGAWVLLLDRDPRRLMGIAIFSSLGYLSHGGAAFSLLAAIPAALHVVRRARMPQLLTAFVSLCILVLPWIAYQRFYEPPGDRLLKWHLAGVVAVDDRSFSEALVEEYRAIGVDGAVHNKVENVVYLTEGSYSSLVLPTTQPTDDRRFDEFHYLWRGLAFGLIALAMYVVFARRRSDEERATGSWIMLTIVVWVVLMFGPSTTDVHQGSLVVPLLLLALPALWLCREHPGWFLVFTGLQATSTALTWLPRHTNIDGRLHVVPMLVLIMGAMAAGVCLRNATRRSVPLEHDRRERREPA